MSPPRLLCLTAACLMFLGLAAEGEDIEADYDAHHHRGAPRGGGDMFPQVVDPPLSGAAEADEVLTGADWVIGVSIGGEHQAFPVAMLALPEIVNTACGGVPIAATW